MFEDLFIKNTFVENDIALPYRLHLPENYSIEKKYPLVLFLHGAGERGDDNFQQLRIGLVTAMSDENSPLHNSIIVAPQCPLDKQWVDTPWSEGAYSVDKTPETPYVHAAISLLKKCRREYSCDKEKTFVMGISMGGFGSWDCLARYPGVFKGAFICCGSGDPSKAEIYKDVRIFTYHGALDETVPVSGTRDTVEAIRKAGGEKVTYVEFPDLGHWSWERAYGRFSDINKLFA